MRDLFWLFWAFNFVLIATGCPFSRPAPPTYGGHIVCRGVPIYEDGETKQVLFCEIAIKPKTEEEEEE